jgi:hypothetical protein
MPSFKGLKMRTTFTIIPLFVSLLSLFVSPVSAQEAQPERFVWDNKDYLHIYGDFNGDGKKDIFLQGATAGHTPLFVIASTDTTGPTFLSNAVMDLYLLRDESILTSRTGVGDFNGDGFDDVVFINTTLERVSVVWGSAQGLRRDTVDEVSMSGQISLNLDDRESLFSGNFNGDDTDDLMMVSPKYDGYVIYHSDIKKGELTFKRKDVIKLEQTEQLSVLVDDYNGDGMDDITVFGYQDDTDHYVHLANNKGKFDKKDVKRIPARIAGENWSAGQHSLITWQRGAGEAADIIRLQNHIGGIDEDGNIIDGNGDISTLTLEELNSDSCQLKVYSPQSDTAQDSCAPWSQESEENALGAAQRVTRITAPLVASQDLEIDPNGGPPATPTNYPFISGSYHPVGGTYQISFDIVSDADYYIVYESTTDSNYSSIYSGSHRVTPNQSQSTHGHRYYRYAACNNEGCSGRSPWRRIFIYTGAGNPNNVNVSPNAIISGQSVSITWTQAGGTVPGGHYRVREVRPNGTNNDLANVPRVSGSNYSYSATPSSGGGTYTYRVRACNPNNLCGGWRDDTVRVNVRPLVSPTSPSNNATYTTAQSVTATATASDSDGSISRVEFRLDNGSWLSDTTAPYSRNLGTLSAGNHTISYRSRDNDGLYSSSGSRHISVIVPPNVAPSVSASSPANNAVFLTTQTVSASANASDSDGSVSRVEFRLDNGGWAPDTSSPYSRSFGTLSAGNHTIYYRARDNDGAYSSQVSRAIRVDVPNVAPSVSPSSPANNTTFLTTQTVSASANASDSDGSVSRVEFRLDNGSWAPDTSSPYSRSFGTLSAGAHTIYYRARDNDGAYSAQTSRAITVEAPNVAPVVSVSAPSNNATFTTAQSVTATASASDSDGSISRVEFRLDSGSWVPDTSSPYGNDFGTLSAGAHTIEYRALDNDGDYSSMATRVISVTPAPPRQGIIYIHTDALGSPSAETNEQGQK